jgi:hypothetical protein
VPCTPARPSCDGVKDIIAARLASQFELVTDKTWAMTCQGVLITRGGPFEPALVVVVSGHDKQGTTRVLRGVVSRDGSRDLVEVGPAPGTRLAGIGDLDHDSGEELVFVDTTSLTVTRITAHGFQDVEGPALPSGCAADVNVEGDFRNGRKGQRKLVVLTVPDGVKGKQCLAPGRHYFELTRDGLSETN